MKTIPFEVDFVNYPVCANNMREALIIIGRIDPFKIRRTTLKRNNEHRTFMSDYAYLNRGVLNVRYALNRNLGKGGKYTNRAIRQTLKITRRQGNTLYLKARVPNKTRDYVKLLTTIYTILWNYSPSNCERLLLRELENQYSPRVDIKNLVFKSVSPIQTNIIMRSSPMTDESKALQDEISRLAMRW